MVEIIVIGNEVLLGIVQDTNSSYLCRTVRGLGGGVSHIAIVGDDIDAVASEIQSSITRRAKLIFTCGGLGPTDDDLTLQAVAFASNKKLQVNSDAREMVSRRYAELAKAGFVDDPVLTETRLKMATLPDGPKPWANPIGAAPGMMLEADGCRIISLPGVPAELQSIVEGPLQPFLAESFNGASYREREINVTSGDESVLAPILRTVSENNPDVYVKSRALRFGPEKSFRILISTTAPAASDAERRIERAIDYLRTALAERGVTIVD